MFIIQQTPCLICGNKNLLNEMQLLVDAKKIQQANLTMDGKTVWHGEISAGKQNITFYIPEPQKAFNAHFVLSGFGEYDFFVTVPRKWEIHVVQLSHHDPGYTDIPSHVLEESTRWLQQALDDMDARDSYTDDDRYRIVIEQSYSLKRFLDTASPKDRARMIERIRKGDVEVTAFYANLISEILSPEEMLRALYPSE